MVELLVPASRLAMLLGDSRLPSPAYRGLADRLRLLVLDGVLTSGVRLPSEPELGAALPLSRTPATAA